MIKLHSVKWLVLASLLVCASNASAEECKPEGAALSISEDFIWVLKGRNDITEEQYSQAYELYLKFKLEYDRCVNSIGTPSAKKES